MGIVAESDMERLKDFPTLQAYAEAHLERAKHGNRYVCPFCKSGGHGGASSDSAFGIFKGSRDGQGRFKCQGCDAKGNIFDLAAEVEGIDPGKFADQLRAVATWAGVPVAEGNARRGAQAGRKEASSPTGKAEPAGNADRPEPDYSEGRERARRYIEQSREDLDNPEAVAYLASRGVSLETARKFGLGYDKAARGIVVPYLGTDWYYMRRYIEPKGASKAYKPPTGEVGNMPLFNADALDGEAVFVVEGEFDALAVLELGFPAVGINGTSGVERYVGALEARADKPVTIVMMDNDRRGKEAADKLAERLNLASLPYLRTSLYSEAPAAKDPDEAAHGAPEAVRAVLSREYAEAVGLRRKDEEERYSNGMRAAGVVSMAEVAFGIGAGTVKAEPTPTGLGFIDEHLDGGLPVGVTVIGAASSTGKTTLLLNIADNIAATRRPVLFVSIEQTAEELAAMSLSRIAHAQGRDLTRMDMLNPPKQANAERSAAIGEAVAEYTKEGGISEWLCVFNGTSRPGTADVEHVANMIMNRTGTAPVIMVDYLQLLKPENDRDTDKTTVDKHMTALRRMSNELHTPVVVISSVNRESYDTDLNVSSLKESGAVEFSADVIITVQIEGVHQAWQNEALKDKKAHCKARRERIEKQDVRDLELRILKYRNGRRDSTPRPFKIDVAHNAVVDTGASRGRAASGKFSRSW